MKLNKYSTNLVPNAIFGISNGIRQATEVVAKTMGSKGINVCLEEDEYPFSRITNDGSTIISRMDFTDPCEKIGLSFLKQACDRSNNNSGDGSTTTCVLLDAILQEGIKSGKTGIEVKKELDTLLPEVVKLIDEQKREVTDVTDVATIAGESAEFGKLLGEIYSKIGKDGIVHLEGSGTYDTSYSYIEGVRFNHTGFLSPYMAHDEQALKESRTETKAVYENPTILVTKRKIATIADINPLLETLTSMNKKDLVIFTDDMDSGVASLLIKAHKEKIINCLIIKAPTVYKNGVFEDFAKCVGATIVEDSSGLNFKNLPISALGTCGKIIVDKNETVLLGTQDISEHIADLKTKDDTESKMRLSWLVTKTVLLKLGSMSETDLSYRLLKMEDAIHSSRLALQGGIVAGGGVCLLNVASSLIGDSTGVKILKQVFQTPYKQISDNAGHVYPKGFDSIVFSEGKNYGLDASCGKIVDMYEAGIIDSADIVKGAVKNALGIASTILTLSSLVSKPEKTPDQLAYEMMQQKGLRM